MHHTDEVYFQVRSSAALSMCRVLSKLPLSHLQHLLIFLDWDSIPNKH